MKRLDSIGAGLLYCWSLQMQFRLFGLVFVEIVLNK